MGTTRTKTINSQILIWALEGKKKKRVYFFQKLKIVTLFYFICKRDCSWSYDNSSLVHVKASFRAGWTVSIFQIAANSRHVGVAVTASELS